MEPTQTSQQPLRQEPAPHASNSKRWVLITCAVIAGILVGVGAYLWQRNNTDTKTPAATGAPQSNSNEIPELSTQIIVEGRKNIWDIGFLPWGQMLFTEREGTVSTFVDGSVKTVAKIGDVAAGGEGGLLGMVIDPKFTENRYVYTCLNTSSDIRIVRWMLDNDVRSLDERTDIVTGIPRNPSGRHSGCRMAFGPDGYLWIGTGDTAQDITPQTPQDPKSLAGKILRVDRDGKAAKGNLTGNFDPRIYSYGHRNTQGIAFFKAPIQGVPGISVEHGSSVDDEVNPLKLGNFGWAPPDGAYNEDVPMTDTDRFPEAVSALWTSGNPTQAPSGVAVVYGDQWKAWDGAIAVAVLKDQHLKFLTVDDTLKVTKEDRRFEGEFGRIRMAVQGPDGSLYISTDNATNDKIIKITPKE
jgi:glucose/arabinose dehydrogenase